MELQPNDGELTLAQLCDAVNSVGQRYGVLTGPDQVSPRSLRFYVAHRLISRAKGRGPGQGYPQKAVWETLFVLRLKGLGLTLGQIKKTRRSVSAKTIHDVVTGKEKVEFASIHDIEAIELHRARGEECVSLAGDEAVEGAGKAKEWRILVREADIELKVRTGVSRGKLRQLKHIAALIRALDEEE